jgi:hypothetical protein
MHGYAKRGGRRLGPAANLEMAPAPGAASHYRGMYLAPVTPGVPHNAQAHDKASLANLPQLRVS